MGQWLLRKFGELVSARIPRFKSWSGRLYYSNLYIVFFSFDVMKAKTVKIIYWSVTILFASFMLFSGISELMGTEQGNKVVLDLGYPLYINLILGVAKILGVIAILQTKFRTIKEWAYAGFTFDIAGASASFALNGGGAGDVLFPLPILAVMFVSYFLWKKVDRL